MRNEPVSRSSAYLDAQDGQSLAAAYWSSLGRRRRAAEGEVVSGLKYDLGERTDAE
jgi:hypothetical protein